MQLLALQTFVEILEIYNALIMYLQAGRITPAAQAEFMFQATPTRYRPAT